MERVAIRLSHAGPAAIGAALEAPQRGAPRGLALIAHGRGGASSSPHVLAIRAAYSRRGWATLTPDLRFSAGNDSPGDPAAFTMAAHLADLLAARDWAVERCRQAGWSARLGFAGHSMGAWAAAVAAAQTVGAAHLLAVSPVVSGAALLAARARIGAEAVEALRREVRSAEREWPGCDARPALGALDAPTGVIVGERDGLTPPQNAREFFAAAASPRFYAALPGQHHCPEGGDYALALDAALVAIDGAPWS